MCQNNIVDDDDDDVDDEIDNDDDDDTDKRGEKLLLLCLSFFAEAKKRDCENAATSQCAFLCVEPISHTNPQTNSFALVPNFNLSVPCLVLPSICHAPVSVLHPQH